MQSTLTGKKKERIILNCVLLHVCAISWVEKSDIAGNASCQEILNILEIFVQIAGETNTAKRIHKKKY